MRDGATRQIASAGAGNGAEEFFGRFRAAIVILSGGASGSEYSLDQSQISLGRGPGVDLAFDDAAMSREHAVVEFYGEGFRIRDLLYSHPRVTVRPSATTIGPKARLNAPVASTLFVVA